MVEYMLLQCNFNISYILFVIVFTFLSALPQCTSDWLLEFLFKKNNKTTPLLSLWIFNFNCLWQTNTIFILINLLCYIVSIKTSTTLYNIPGFVDFNDFFFLFTFCYNNNFILYYLYSKWTNMKKIIIENSHEQIWIILRTNGIMPVKGQVTSIEPMDKIPKFTVLKPVKDFRSITCLVIS